MQRYRRALGKRSGLRKVIVSASGDVDPTSRSLRDPDQGGFIIATVEEADHPHLAALAERGEVWRLGRGQVDLPALLHQLDAEGIERLLIEGGAELNWQCFQADLIDELFLTLAPTLLGGRDAPTPVDGQGFGMADQRRLELLEIGHHEGELYLRYRVRR